MIASLATLQTIEASGLAGKTSGPSADRDPSDDWVVVAEARGIGTVRIEVDDVGLGAGGERRAHDDVVDDLGGALEVVAVAVGGVDPERRDSPSAGRRGRRRPDSPPTRSGRPARRPALAGRRQADDRRTPARPSPGRGASGAGRSERRLTGAEGAVVVPLRGPVVGDDEERLCRRRGTAPPATCGRLRRRAGRRRSSVGASRAGESESAIVRAAPDDLHGSLARAAPRFTSSTRAGSKSRATRMLPPGWPPSRLFSGSIATDS